MITLMRPSWTSSTACRREAIPERAMALLSTESCSVVSSSCISSLCVCELRPLAGIGGRQKKRARRLVKAANANSHSRAAPSRHGAMQPVFTAKTKSGMGRRSQQSGDCASLSCSCKGSHVARRAAGRALRQAQGSWH